ncbi:hypothetical protein OS187_06170 [Xanthomonadaceae bacterium JHOS43]|nr:hypothetical protein [Xanthomonadaceae bacterium JHOS43]MCX7563096.1 hypothetical protein [Xanthomonadaceae bacterium XH05]
MTLPTSSDSELEVRRRRGVRATVVVVGAIALLIYVGFVTGLIGR